MARYYVFLTLSIIFLLAACSEENTYTASEEHSDIAIVSPTAPSGVIASEEPGGVPLSDLHVKIGPITNLTTRAGVDSITLNWNSPSLNTPITYRVQYRRCLYDCDAWTTLGTPEPRINITGLTPDGTYQFRVAALNLGGVGDFSPAIEAVPGSVPSAPKNVIAYIRVESTMGNYGRLGILNIYWDPPSLPGSIKALSYVVEYKPIHQEEWLIASTSVQSRRSLNRKYWWDYNYLIPRTWYSIRLAAINQHGIGLYSYLTKYWHGSDTGQYTASNVGDAYCRAVGEWWVSDLYLPADRSATNLITTMQRLYPGLIHDDKEWSPELRNKIKQYEPAYKSGVEINHPKRLIGQRVPNYENAHENWKRSFVWSYVDSAGNPTHLITNKFQLISSGPFEVTRTYEVPRNCRNPLDGVGGIITDADGDTIDYYTSVRPASTPAQNSPTISNDPAWKTFAGGLRVTEIPQEFPPYNREEWADWNDFNYDCQDTRAEVLIEESLDPVTFKTKNNCVVASGRWIDPFTGNEYTDASALDVDHMVPLKNAHNSGAATWSHWDKKIFATDLMRPETLIAVSASANRSKGARGPEAWRPENKQYWCDYATNWIKIKLRWNLTVTETEKEALSDMLGTCD